MTNLALNNLGTVQILVCILAFALTSCAVNSEAVRAEERRKREEESERRIREHKAQLERITAQYTPKDPTPEDVALANEKRNIYYAGLIRSIRAIDDSVTPADAVGRAAVSENIDELRAWKRAQMAHLARPSEWAAQEVAKSIAGLPSKGLLDEATSIVLRSRKGTLFDE